MFDPNIDPMIRINEEKAKLDALMKEMNEVNRLAGRGLIIADEYISMSLVIFSKFGYKFSFTFDEEENV